MAEQESKDSGGAAVAEQVLSIMEIILDESNAEPLSEDKVRAWGSVREWKYLLGFKVCKCLITVMLSFRSCRGVLNGSLTLVTLAGMS